MKHCGLNRLCFITPSGADRQPLEQIVTSVLQCGVRWVQYRDKERDSGQLYQIALDLRAITSVYSAMLIINDRVDIALAVGADGVHLGQSDLPLVEARKLMGQKVIGISTHNVPEALEAESKGADYIGFGAVFPTQTKADAVTRGLQALRAVAESVAIPVIAIGGITSENARYAFETGCHAVALSSGLMTGDIAGNVRRLSEHLGSL